MIPIPLKMKKKIDEDAFFRRCCHQLRPDFTGEDKASYDPLSVQMEHPWSRKYNMAGIIVPVNPKFNYSPDKKSKAWSKLVAFEYYGIDHLKKLHPKKDWDAELRLCKSFFI